ncbi:succinate dehydrogenase, hydrophobic membrane anchor protein [Orrella sp. 11846]|uniref:succinate dehydrogenase, hydrophobic membrane anchor protein n=1 Tax=Orrella sp. 11846 TaxID=3409913 RepID=UPI003B596469
MTTQEKIGAKRLTVGAHYGWKDFLVQRMTAVIMAVYTIVLFVGILMMSGFTYEGWKALFTFTLGAFPMGQVLATLAFLSLAWHAWIGVRDIWMDYIKSAGLRLFLQVLTVLWLLASIFYFVKILWSI